MPFQSYRKEKLRWVAAEMGLGDAHDDVGKSDLVRSICIARAKDGLGALGNLKTADADGRIGELKRRGTELFGATSAEQRGDAGKHFRNAKRRVDDTQRPSDDGGGGGDGDDHRHYGVDTGDLNADGVDDRDDDGDGLPNAVEEGLDALDELLGGGNSPNDAGADGAESDAVADAVLRKLLEESCGRRGPHRRSGRRLL